MDRSFLSLILSKRHGGHLFSKVNSSKRGNGFASKTSKLAIVFDHSIARRLDEGRRTIDFIDIPKQVQYGVLLHTCVSLSIM
jgi:hypothetical protein